MARDLFTVLQVPHQLPARMFRPEHFHVIRTFFCAMARILIIEHVTLIIYHYRYKHLFSQYRWDKSQLKEA